MTPPALRNRIRLAERSQANLDTEARGRAPAAKLNGDYWKRRYRWTVVGVDACAIIVAVALAQLGRFGIPEIHNDAYINVTVFSVLLALMWLVTLGLQQSWDLSLVGVGTEEYRRVFMATAWVFGILATLGLLLQAQMARGYLVIALPAGLFTLLLGRHLLRRFLSRKRVAGQFTSQVIVMGTPGTIVDLCKRLNRSKSSGYRVIGAVVPNYAAGFEDIPTPSGPIPILGDETAIEDALLLTDADAVAVTAVERLGHERMRTLAWHLDSLRIDMIVMPGMTDIAGPRLKVRPIDDLPLFHIARPRHDGSSRYGKRCFDLIIGSMALLAAIPVMLVIALAIKLDDGGPIFFRQQRVGLHGTPFRIFKFRTMHIEADAYKQQEQEACDSAECVFFKSATDSRITTVGHILRKTSLDEIPQVFNVLAGSMSIVGPRPLVPGEGAAVKHFIERRALVKPGMTGLWQVSGRSDVSDEERVRLDHSYVDNWSFITDLLIVWRTARAVLKREGAY